MAGTGSVEMGVRAQNQETSSSRHHWLIAAPGMLLTSRRQCARCAGGVRQSGARCVRALGVLALAGLRACLGVYVRAITQRPPTLPRRRACLLSRGVRAEMATVKVCARDKQRMNVKQRPTDELRTRLEEYMPGITEQR